MKRKILLLSAVLAAVFTMNAATHTVTNPDPMGAGGVVEKYLAAQNGDIINFNLEDVTEIILPQAFEVGKDITIDGLNLSNSERLVVKQSIATSEMFNIPSGRTVTLKNIVLDGTGTSRYGLYALAGSNLTVDNCVFQKFVVPSASGGASNINGTATFTNCVFKDNSSAAANSGGAICILSEADVTIDKCTFINNTSTSTNGGGAIFARASIAGGTANVKITNSSFLNNTATVNGSGILAILQTSNAATTLNISVINCTFTGNQGLGAVSARVTSQGRINFNLINSNVIYNANTAGTQYDDIKLIRNSGTALIYLKATNVLYSTLADTQPDKTTLTNCIEVADPNTANIFTQLEDFATGFKRPVISTAQNGQMYAPISQSGLATNAGAAVVSGFIIPTDDQLGTTRPNTPSIGAVEYNTATGTSLIKGNDDVEVKVVNKVLTVSGLSSVAQLSIYDIRGTLLHQNTVNNNEQVDLSNLASQLVIVKVNNKGFKALLK